MLDDADGEFPPDSPDAAASDREPEAMAKLLDGIPGFSARVSVARGEVSRGEGVPLEDL